MMARSASRRPESVTADLSLVLADDAVLARLHREYLADADTTDVMSFRYAPVPGEKESGGGEIVINVERAIEVGARGAANRRGWNAARELALYIAHGCDHLAGSTDATPEDRRRMRRRELRWVAEAAANGLTRDIIDMPGRSCRRRHEESGKGEDRSSER